MSIVLLQKLFRIFMRFEKIIFDDNEYFLVVRENRTMRPPLEIRSLDAICL